MRKLIINGTVADLPKGEVIALSKEINSLWDFKDKRSNLSNTITLPYSQANNIIFGNAKDATITDTAFRNFYSVVYIQDYVQVISTGKAKLTKAGINGYEIVISWGNVELADILADKTLQDLDLSDLNHVWNDANVRALYVPTAPIYDCVYPFYNPSTEEADLFNAGTVADPMFSSWFIPFVQLRRLILQIAADNNLEFVGGIENVDNSVYVPVANNDFRPEYNIKVSFLQRDITGTPDGINIFNLPMIYDNIISDESGLISPSTGYYQCAESAAYYCNISLMLMLKFSKIDFSQNVKFDIYNVFYFEKSSDAGITWSLINTIITDTISVDESNEYKYSPLNTSLLINLSTNDLFRIRVENYLTLVSNINAVLFYHTPETEYSITSDKMTFGNTWNIARNMPDIKQIDILKYACVLGGFIFEKKENSNYIYFYKYDDIITSTDVQDLSDYMERYEINDFHAPLAQSNRLKYSNDETVKETLGDGFLLIDDDTLERTQDLYEAPFGASAIETFTTPAADSLLIARIPLLNQDLSWVKLSPRILSLQVESINCYYRNLSNTNLVASKFVAKFTASDLIFTNILNKAYQAYSETVNDYKDVSVWCDLSTARFYDLDLSRPAYFKQLGAKFIIQKVKDFVKGAMTELQLIKIK